MSPPHTADKERLHKEGVAIPAWLERLVDLLRGAPRDRKSLLKLLQSAEVRELLDRDALDMIEGILKLAGKQVRDIMVPRIRMVTVRADDAPEEVLMAAAASGHSRLPVLRESPDSVLGILICKDLLDYRSTPELKKLKLADLVRPALFVPESKRLGILLREFRSTRSHMAIVVDEYGGVAGLVTIEDIIEEIVGEIEDEHDPEREEAIRALGDDHFEVQALTSIERLNDFFDSELDNEEYDTVGGLVLKGFGRMPKVGETCDYRGMHIVVKKADKRRIHAVEIRWLDNKRENDNEVREDPPADDWAAD